MISVGCPASGANRRPGAINGTQPSYPTEAEYGNAYERRASLVSERQLEAERSLIALGWLDPVAFNDACFRYGINGDTFRHHDLRFIGAYLVECAERALMSTIADLTRLAREHDVPIRKRDLHVLFDTDIRAFMIDVYAEELIELRRRCQKAAEHILAAAEELNVPTHVVEAAYIATNETRSDRPAQVAVPSYVRRRLKGGLVRV